MASQLLFVPRGTIDFHSRPQVLGSLRVDVENSFPAAVSTGMFRESMVHKATADSIAITANCMRSGHPLFGFISKKRQDVSYFRKEWTTRPQECNRRTCRSSLSWENMFRSRIVQLTLVLATLISSASAQFAHTSHKQIVDGAGKPLLIRGIGLGNWLVPEGYMWLFQNGPQSAGEIHALLLELLGPDESAAFWQKYRENYITRDDIALLHRSGFNAVRVPMHHALFENDDAEGFKLLDRLVAWCREEGLYVILDMHAAPGGQTGTNIDDSAGYPWLFQSPQEQQHLIDIWKKLATRYRDQPSVLGYDLLNEPIPPFPGLAPLNAALEPLYKRLSAEIRAVDTHHILFLGGAQWDSNFSVFGPPFDHNVVYTFHKYWTAPDESVLRPYIDFRERYDVPIWLGESGENADEWIAQFVALLEKNQIGWAFWPYKKMEKASAVVSIIPPAEWPQIVEFAKLPRGTAHVEERLKLRPERALINRVFAELLENVRLQKCRINPGYLKALGTGG